ncbi:Fatty acid-binding protein 5 [Galemys pyrenaicus]|uniref:Fatty acid-binding protein 5 n=1 Tax=Galemys pyrenaicus TaxID=202257 RepID=A0A8J6AEH0_GALPY|nr:Fatty acid-binding protein 5 [Galemys pyrenaicus]
MQELGVGMALQKMDAMTKTDCVIGVSGNHLMIKTESTLVLFCFHHFENKFPFNLEEKFEEITAEYWAKKKIATLQMKWDEKESGSSRKLEDGKLVVKCTMNNECHLYLGL